MAWFRLNNWDAFGRLAIAIRMPSAGGQAGSKAITRNDPEVLE